MAGRISCGHRRWPDWRGTPFHQGPLAAYRQPLARPSLGREHRGYRRGSAQLTHTAHRERGGANGCRFLYRRDFRWVFVLIFASGAECGSGHRHCVTCHSANRGQLSSAGLRNWACRPAPPPVSRPRGLPQVMVADVLEDSRTAGDHRQVGPGPPGRAHCFGNRPVVLAMSRCTACSKDGRSSATVAATMAWEVSKYWWAR